MNQQEAIQVLEDEYEGIQIGGEPTQEQIDKRKQEYEEWVQQLVREHSWSPRKARRFIQSRSNKVLKKFKKQVFNNRNKPKQYVEPPTDLPEDFLEPK